MAQTVLITLTAAGADTGPFDLYTDADGYVTPFANDIAKATLEAGYTSVVVPDGATIIRVQSDNSICENFTDLSIVTTTTSTSTTSTTTTSTTTSTSTSSTTTTTTTAAPVSYNISGSVNTTINTANTLEQEITLTISPTPAIGVTVTSTFNWGLSSAVSDIVLCSASAFLQKPDLTTENCTQNCTDSGTFTAVFTNASPTELVIMRGDVSAGGVTETASADVTSSYVSSIITGGTGTVGATGSAASHLLTISIIS